MTPRRTDDDGGPVKQRTFHGWWLVAAGSAIQFVMSALMQQSFGFYAAALVKEYGWSRGTVGSAFSFARVEGPMGPAQGWMVARYGARRVLQLGIVIMAGGSCSSPRSIRSGSFSSSIS